MQYLKEELLKVAKISFDTENPRGLSPIQIEKDLDVLIESIKNLGVLQPIIVKPKENNKEEYILIDGERRLRATKKANITEIPARIATSEANGRIMAYNVHMLHKKWTLAAETIAVKRIIEEIKKEKPNIKESDLKKQVKQLTKYPNNRLNDLWKVVKFNNKYIKKSIEGTLDVSYLVRIEVDFIRKIKSKYPSIFKNYNDDKLRIILAEKAINGLLVGTRYMMDTFKDVFSDKQNKQTIERLLLEFLESKNKSISETYCEWQNIYSEESDTDNVGKEKQEDENVTRGKDDSVDSSEMEEDKGEESSKEDKYDKNDDKELNLDYSKIKLTKKQQTKIDDIRPKYESIGKKLSDEETEYIKEALHCLKIQCFKASVLMIWSTGISKVLKFIEKDISKFSTASQEMKDNNKSFYRHHCLNFQTNATDIDGIRHASKDIQLLSYICFENKIDESQFKKLKNNYDTRNDCAHPTQIKLEVNETIAIFENIYNLVLNNNKLI